MTAMISKNLPRPTPETQPYWDGCQEQQLLIQRCDECSHFQFYPRILCTRCTSSQLSWTKADGKGQVISYTIVHRAITQAYAADVPYVVALIRLAEGPCMMSNLVGCDPDGVTIGMAVHVDFENWSEDFMVPVFRPI